MPVSLIGRKVIAFDLETKCLVADPKSKTPLIEGHVYAKGWGDRVGMGIAVLACFDFATLRYRVFMDDNWDEFGKLVQESEWIIGYNNTQFDNKVVAAHGVEIPDAKVFDMFVEIRKLVGVGIPGYKLDDMCRANVPQARKVGTGEMAPVLWQTGQIGKLIDYCINDVTMTAALFKRLHMTGYLEDPGTGRPLEIKSPIV